jgi:aspartate-semialdehyde dehydrogenase
MAKISVGVIGATGMVGQNYIRLLENHPWFEVTYVAASARSAGKSYQEAVDGRWLMEAEIPQSIRNLPVADANITETAVGKCKFIFSAVEIDKESVRKLEEEYANRGLPVVSNNSAHRHTSDVPMLIPEINPGHIEVIPSQQKRLGDQGGFIVVKPNCSLQSYMTPVYALIQAGYPVSEMIITTMQAVSGAGYPGPASLDLIDNVVPFIGGEEEKSEVEPLKILGSIENNEIKAINDIRISAHCNRVPVTDGHVACTSLKFRDKKPGMDEILAIWRHFKSVPQELDLPFAPKRPIIVREENNRPQPRKDRNDEKAMAVSVGRLRSCNVFDIRFVGLSHNTVRGAAGGGILNAELLKAKGFLS